MEKIIPYKKIYLKNLTPVEEVFFNTQHVRTNTLINPQNKNSFDLEDIVVTCQYLLINFTLRQQHRQN